MKTKTMLLVASICGIGLFATACGNRTIEDVQYTFNRANIRLQTGETITVDIKSWRDYDGEQLQIIAKDGTVYLVNSVNCDLIKTK